MRRDNQELHDRMDTVVRLARAIKRTTAQVPAVAEEDYDNLHAQTLTAHDALRDAWKTWAAAALARGEGS